MEWRKLLRTSFRFIAKFGEEVYIEAIIRIIYSLTLTLERSSSYAVICVSWFGFIKIILKLFTYL